MFSTFDRTGEGPHKRTGKFCLGVMLTTLSVCVSCEFSRAVKSIKLTVMSKKGSSVFGGKKMGSIREGPHIFF